MLLFLIKGWLRFIPFAEKPSRAPDDYRFWVVFLVLKQTDPYLEFYSKRQLLPHLSTDPVSIHSLKRCRHIAPAIAVNDQCANEFAISLDTHVIRLVADSQHSMTEWCLAIKTKLRQLKVLTPKVDIHLLNLHQGSHAKFTLQRIQFKGLFYLGVGIDFKIYNANFKNFPGGIFAKFLN